MQDILDSESNIPEIESREEQLLKLYIGNNEDYYLEKWKSINQGKIASFNIAAFFLSIFRLLYRKMYFEFLILLSINIGMAVVDTYLIEPLLSTDLMDIYNLLSGLALWLVLGFYGNYFYLKRAQLNISNLENEGYPEEQLKAKIVEKGGTSMRLVVLVFVISIATLYILL